MTAGADDAVLARRACIARLSALGQRVGYLLFGVASVAFVVAFVVGPSAAWVWTVVGALVAGSVVLAPSIVLGYAVKAAEKEDREQGL